MMMTDIINIDTIIIDIFDNHLTPFLSPEVTDHAATIAIVIIKIYGLTEVLKTYSKPLTICVTPSPNDVVSPEITPNAITISIVRLIHMGV